MLAHAPLGAQALSMLESSSYFPFDLAVAGAPVTLRETVNFLYSVIGPGQAVGRSLSPLRVPPHGQDNDLLGLRAFGCSSEGAIEGPFTSPAERDRAAT